MDAAQSVTAGKTKYIFTDKSMKYSTLKSNHMRNLTMLKFNRPGAKATRIVGSLVVGTAVGMAIGTLLAPESGAETRRKIAEKGNDMLASVKDEFRNLVKTVKKEAHEQKEQVTENAEEYADDFRESMEPEARSASSAPGEEQKNRYDTEFMG
jgi:gas vesicle protein